MIVECRYCKKHFNIRPSRIAKGEGKHCSKECYEATRRKPTMLNCITCGKAFKRRACYLDNKGWGKYCSIKCEFSKTLKERFEEKYLPVPETGCWLWIGTTFRLGYGSIRVSGKIRSAHRVSWELYRGPIPEGLDVLHSCDTPACVNPLHLSLGTHKDNMRDMVNRKRIPPKNGEASGNNKLKTKEVIKIKADTRKGSVIAKEYGVSKATISAIKRGRTWTHVI